MKKLILKTFIIFAFTACSENLLDEFADKDTDAAKFKQAQIEINALNWTGAITLLEEINVSNPAYLTSRERIGVYASAYAGDCGLEFISLLDSIQNAGASAFLGLLMDSFHDADDATADDSCNTAESILKSIGNETVRDANENFLIAFNALVEIGTILSFRMDVDDDGAGDAPIANPNGRHCQAASLPDADVQQIGAAIAVFISSMTAIGTGFVDDAIGDITAICGPPLNFTELCTATDPADAVWADPNNLRALRTLIGTTDVGVGTCGQPVASCIPCP